jgi:hypothetical protein
MGGTHIYGVRPTASALADRAHGLVLRPRRSQTPHALGRLVAANELPPGWLAAVADAAHHIIARSEQEVAFIGKELPPAQWHHAGPGGVFEFIDSEGRPSLEAPVRSELTGWETAVWAPKAVLEAPVRALWWTIAFDGVAGVYVGGWLGLMAGPDYRALGRPRGSRCNRSGSGRTDAAERNPCC